jgi:hypothetical protein
VSAVSPDWLIATTSVFCGVIRRSAADQTDFWNRASHVFRQNIRQINGILLQRNMALKGILDRQPLLEYLLQHEMRKPRFFSHGRVPVDRFRRSLDRLIIGIPNLNLIPPKLGHVAIFQINHLARVGQESGYIRSQKRRALPDSENQGRILPGRDKPFAIVRGQHT